ncbi:hypothetical protein [Phytobacter sp. V91]|uniref:hypothetical protein n=1 Tax=Phytobacter sp. V91 TaxID=3369425 RepID=UPI003F614DF6
MKKNHGMIQKDTSIQSLGHDKKLVQRVTDFEQPNDEHSTTEAGIFGIGPAGWVYLEQSHANKTKYGWDKSPLDNGENIYSLETFFEEGWKTMSTDNKLALLSGWADNMFYSFDDDKNDKVKIELENGVKASVIVQREFGGGEEGFMYFVKWAKNETQANTEMKASANKVISIKDDSQKEAFFQSKGGLVGVLQENVKRFYAGKPLIPTYLALRKKGADSASDFIPNMKGTRDKSTTFTTDKEIRMIYKLTEEAPDPKLNDIAKKTFFFVEQDATDEAHRMFKTIPSPWASLDTDYSSRSTEDTDNYGPDGQQKWASRTRKGNQMAYKDRMQDNIPLWMKELSDYRKEQEKLSVDLTEISGTGGKHIITSDADNLNIKRSFTTQMGQLIERITSIPFKELRDAKINYEADGGGIEVTISRGAGDYLMMLSVAQANQFKYIVRRYLGQK